MDRLKVLFDYQQFDPNSRLQEQVDGVYRRYFCGGEALPDEALDVAAAGDPWQVEETKPSGERGTL